MADVQVVGATLENGKVTALQVRFFGTAERSISRETAIAWLAEGHSLVTHSGSAHHPHRGLAVERIFVGDEVFLRTNTTPKQLDEIVFPGSGH
jgi:hypothetical protein